jgi:tyrosyl-tRNA synthetase
VAGATVALYHGGEAAQAAEAAFDRQFKEGRAPEDVAQASIPQNAIDADTVFLPRVLAELGLASSRSEARRLIAGHGVRVNGATINTEEVPLAELKGALLQVGKRRFVRLAE